MHNDKPPKYKVAVNIDGDDVDVIEVCRHLSNIILKGDEITPVGGILITLDKEPITPNNFNELSKKHGIINPNVFKFRYSSDHIGEGAVIQYRRIDENLYLYTRDFIDRSTGKWREHLLSTSSYNRVSIDTLEKDYYLVIDYHVGKAVHFTVVNNKNNY